jgi:conjugative transfer signal peptidase TraF
VTRQTRRILAAASLAGIAALGLLLAFHPAPCVIWNTTTSAPVGLYLTKAERKPTVGDWVFVRPPAKLARQLGDAGFLPLGALLLKRIAALAPTLVCRVQADVTLDGRTAATALALDRFGRQLPAWSGCRLLADGEVFLLNPEPRSLDSRYFGPLPAALIVGRAVPLLVEAGAADAR